MSCTFMPEDAIYAHVPHCQYNQEVMWEATGLDMDHVSQKEKKKASTGFYSALF